MINVPERKASISSCNTSAQVFAAIFHISTQHGPLGCKSKVLLPRGWQYIAHNFPTGSQNSPHIAGGENNFIHSPSVKTMIFLDIFLPSAYNNSTRQATACVYPSVEA